MTGKVPISQVIGQLEIMPLQNGDIPLSAIVLIKVVDEDGDVVWVGRQAGEMQSYEVIGALIQATDRVRAAAVQTFRGDG